jgi:hypothetical protein
MVSAISSAMDSSVFLNSSNPMGSRSALLTVASSRQGRLRETLSYARGAIASTPIPRKKPVPSAGTGARRLTDERGNPYWDLKPDYVLGEDVVL